MLGAAVVAFSYSQRLTRHSMFAHAAWTKEKTVTGPGDAVLGAVIGNRGISTCLAEKTMRISLSC